MIRGSLVQQPRIGAAPQISIGMPVYNGEGFICEALDSLLGQTYTDFELIISDNASTDATEAICKQYAQKDQRIRYVRHEKNRGASQNFQFVLDEAKGEYFMWHAVDDLLVGIDYILKCITYLQVHVSVVGVIICSGTGLNWTLCRRGYTGFDEIQNEQRQFNFIHSLPNGNARYHCLWRKQELLNSYIKDGDFYASDWVTILRLLNEGPIHVLLDKENGYIKRAGGLGDSATYQIKLAKCFLDMVFPLRRFVQFVPPSLKRKTRFKLIQLQILGIINFFYLAKNKIFLKSGSESKYACSVPNARSTSQ